VTFPELVEAMKTLFEPVTLEDYPEEFGYVLNSSREIARVGYATNLDQVTAGKAIAMGIDALLTHHDAWDFLYDLRTKAYETLRRAGISHCYVHLPLDAAPFGTAATLAERLGLEIREPFARDGDFLCGRICDCPSPIRLEELATRLTEVMGCEPRVWRHHPREVRRVGITTGAGNLTDLLREASGWGCDTYITGETNLYTVAYARNQELNLLVGTHTHTEFPGVESLCNRLRAIMRLDFVPIKEECFEIGAMVESDEQAARVSE